MHYVYNRGGLVDMMRLGTWGSCVRCLPYLGRLDCETWDGWGGGMLQDDTLDRWYIILPICAFRSWRAHSARFLGGLGW